MIRIIAQTILSAAGVIVALFVSRDEANFPLLQMALSMVGLLVAALIIWLATNPRQK